jgi:pantoate kinase
MEEVNIIIKKLKRYIEHLEKDRDSYKQMLGQWIFLLRQEEKRTHAYEKKIKELEKILSHKN